MMPCLLEEARMPVLGGFVTAGALFGAFLGLINDGCQEPHLEKLLLFGDSSKGQGEVSIGLAGNVDSSVPDYLVGNSDEHEDSNKIVAPACATRCLVIATPLSSGSTI